LVTLLITNLDYFLTNKGNKIGLHFRCIKMLCYFINTSKDFLLLILDKNTSKDFLLLILDKNTSKDFLLLILDKQHTV